MEDFAMKKNMQNKKVEIKKSGKMRSIEGVVKKNTHPRYFSKNARYYGISGDREIAQHLSRLEAWRQNLNVGKGLDTPITIIGDYDCDGICATKILADAIKAVGFKVITVRLPKRFSEGYGVNPSMIDDIEEGILMLVDNGITAHEAIKKAKEKGLYVVVMDHHERRKDWKLPEADIITYPEGSLCGAAIAYCVASQLGVATKEMLVLASIATIADVVPLMQWNHQLVREGLEAIHEGIMPFGLRKLLEEFNINPKHIDEEDYGFILGPLFNAPGRLYDNGAMKALEVLNLDYKDPRGVYKVKSLIKINQMRKDLCKQQVLLAESLLEGMDTQNGIVLFHHEFHQGIVGIVASKLVDKYHVPVLLLCRGKDGFVKGSGRAENENLKELLDECSDHLVAYGGHEKAAGVTLTEENLESFVNAFHRAVEKENKKNKKKVYSKYEYDLELHLDKLEQTLKEVQKYAPYATEKMPKIRFHLTLNTEDYQCSVMGEEKDHVKLVNKNFPIFSVVGFGFNQQYQTILSNHPDSNIEVVGTLRESWYTKKREIVLNVTAMA